MLAQEAAEGEGIARNLEGEEEERIMSRMNQETFTTASAIFDACNASSPSPSSTTTSTTGRTSTAAGATNTAEESIALIWNGLCNGDQ